MSLSREDHEQLALDAYMIERENDFIDTIHPDEYESLRARIRDSLGFKTYLLRSQLQLLGTECTMAAQRFIDRLDERLRERPGDSVPVLGQLDERALDSESFDDTPRDVTEPKVRGAQLGSLGISDDDDDTLSSHDDQGTAP